MNDNDESRSIPNLPTQTSHPTTLGCPDYIHAEVACDFNAGFASAVAALKQLSMRGIHY